MSESSLSWLEQLEPKAILAGRALREHRRETLGQRRKAKWRRSLFIPLLNELVLQYSSHSLGGGQRTLAAPKGLSRSR